MQEYRQNPYEVAGYIKNAIAYLRPPEDITVSQWAEKYRVLDSRSSAMPGPWRNDVTPYMVEIMDCFDKPEIEEIVFVKPTQVGGTEAIFNAIGKFACTDPAPAMLVEPTDELGASISKNRIVPMIKASKELKRHWNERTSETLELQFEGMYLSINGANSPSALASKPVKILLLDEVDKYPGASLKEADPVKLAIERTKTFIDRKIYMCSTPTLKSGTIWKYMLGANVIKHYFVPCPHCGKMIELKFKNVIFPSSEDCPEIEDRASQAVYICQECGQVITDAEKRQALKKGKWEVVHDRGGTKRTAFWMNTLYSPFVKFSEVAREYLTCLKDPDALHNFVNSWLAEVWEDADSSADEDDLMKKQTEYERYVVPPWAKMLTGGVDVQENCLYWVIRAWGDNMTSANIAHGQALSFDEVARYMNLEYERTDGAKLLPQMALIDSGDQTDDVYDFCLKNSDWAKPCKGTAARLSHYTISKINKEGPAYGMTLILVDGGKYKDSIANGIKKENGLGAWMIYKECDMEYAKQITAEHKVNIRGKNGRVTQVWKQKHSHGDNHYLDAEVYAYAAADMLGVRSLYLQNTETVTEEVPDKRNAEEESWIGNHEDWL